MSHRRALLMSLILTLVAGIGIIVMRERFLTGEAAPQEPLVTVQTLGQGNLPGDQSGIDDAITGEWPSTKQREDERELDEIWERILSGSRHERDDDHEGEWDHDD